MFSKLSVLSLLFVAAASVNAMSYDDYIMERELSAELLDAREAFEPLYEVREPMDFPEVREPDLAEIREALEFLAMDAREPAPAPNKKHHKHQPPKHVVHKHNNGHKHNHKHNKVVVVEKVVHKPAHHNHNHKVVHKVAPNNNKVVLVKQAPTTKTITVNGAKQTVIQQVGGPTITLAPQGTVTVYQGKTYTIAKPKATPVNKLKFNLKNLGKKNGAQSVSAGSVKLYTFLGAMAAVGALFA